MIKIKNIDFTVFIDFYPFSDYIRFRIKEGLWLLYSVYNEDARYTQLILKKHGVNFTRRIQKLRSLLLKRLGIY